MTNVFDLNGRVAVVTGGNGGIGRFSEDIDILIEPPAGRNVKTGKNHDKPAHIQSRNDFFDWLAQTTNPGARPSAVAAERRGAASMVTSWSAY